MKICPVAVSVPALPVANVPAELRNTFFTALAPLSAMPVPMPAVAAIGPALTAVPPPAAVVIDCCVRRSMNVAVPARVAAAPEAITEPSAVLQATPVLGSVRARFQKLYASSKC